MSRTKEHNGESFNGINTSGAARYCGVSEGLLRKFRQNGEGPLYCKVGKKVVYRKRDWDRYLEECLVGWGR